MEKINLFNLTYTELETTIKTMHQPTFRAKQLADWLYKKLVFDIDLMLNIPKNLKQTISDQCSIELPSIDHVAHSKTDNSYKFLLRPPANGGKTADHEKIEAILMLENRSSRKRATICVSCMVGCPLACKFCATGSEIGFVRKLSCAEIVGQVLAILKHAQENNYTQTITNIVFMGMGEPFLNLEAVEKAIDLLTHPDCFGLSPSRIAVSTAGVGPNIAQFINKTGVRLAISLHFPTDELRTQYMPVNKQFPLKNLIAELKKVRLKKRDYILIEYLMLDGINDSLAHAKQLHKLISGLKVKVNLIPYNPTKTLPTQTSSEEALDTFATYLKDKGIFTSVRRSKGLDVEGGCGQFVLKT